MEVEYKKKEEEEDYNIRPYFLGDTTGFCHSTAGRSRWHTFVLYPTELEYNLHVSIIDSNARVCYNTSIS